MDLFISLGVVYLAIAGLHFCSFFSAMWRQRMTTGRNLAFISWGAIIWPAVLILKFYDRKG